MWVILTSGCEWYWPMDRFTLCSIHFYQLWLIPDCFDCFGLFCFILIYIYIYVCVLILTDVEWCWPLFSRCFVGAGLWGGGQAYAKYAKIHANFVVLTHTHTYIYIYIYIFINKTPLSLSLNFRLQMLTFNLLGGYYNQ